MVQERPVRVERRLSAILDHGIVDGGGVAVADRATSVAAHRIVERGVATIADRTANLSTVCILEREFNLPISCPVAAI
jgi:hypothetical protein